MARHKFSFVALALVLTWGSMTWAVEQEQNPKQNATAVEHDFSDKILVISTKSDSETGGTLAQVQIRSLAGKSFLVGTMVDDGQPSNWAVGQAIWIPVDEVAMIVEFPDVKTLKEAYKRAGQ